MERYEVTFEAHIMTQGMGASVIVRTTTGPFRGKMTLWVTDRRTIALLHERGFSAVSDQHSSWVTATEALHRKLLDLIREDHAEFWNGFNDVTGEWMLDEDLLTEQA